MKRVLLFFTLSFLFLIIAFLVSNSQQYPNCVSCGCWCEGSTVKCQDCKEYDTCKDPKTNIVWDNGCIKCGDPYEKENCNDYDKFVCGCYNYRSDKYVCFENWYCLDGACRYTYVDPTYCGDSTDSDNGDNPKVKGIVVDKYCDNGACKSETYEDTCSGICSRSDLTEYYVYYERKTSKTYTDLFSKGQYCKNGAIYDDTAKPSVSLNLNGKDWTNSDITETLYCNDNDESGCWKYNYKIV